MLARRSLVAYNKFCCAEVVELVDTLGSGSSSGNGVGVRLSPSAPMESKAGRNTSLFLFPGPGIFCAGHGWQPVAGNSLAPAFFVPRPPSGGDAPRPWRRRHQKGTRPFPGGRGAFLSMSDAGAARCCRDGARRGLARSLQRYGQPAQGPQRSLFRKLRGLPSS